MGLDWTPFSVTGAILLAKEKIKTSKFLLFNMHPCVVATSNPV
jgi:hypothetical protein